MCLIAFGNFDGGSRARPDGGSFGGVDMAVPPGNFGHAKTRDESRKRCLSGVTLAGACNRVPNLLAGGVGEI